MKKTIIKGVNLVLFISLVGSFALYRSDVFGDRTTSYAMSPNGSVINSSTSPTVPATDSIAKQPVITSSSKVIIIKDPIVHLKDTAKTSNGTNFIIRKKDLLHLKTIGLSMNALHGSKEPFYFGINLHYHVRMSYWIVNPNRHHPYSPKFLKYSSRSIRFRPILYPFAYRPVVFRYPQS